jgi:hypothetical protein
MGFNKCYVQPLDAVKQQFEELGLEKFKELYRKRDTFIGPEDAVDFILEKLQQKSSDTNQEQSK